MGLTKTVTGFGSFSFSVCLSFLPFPYPGVRLLNQHSVQKTPSQSLLSRAPNLQLSRFSPSTARTIPQGTRVGKHDGHTGLDSSPLGQGHREEKASEGAFGGWCNSHGTLVRTHAEGEEAFVVGQGITVSEHPLPRAFPCLFQSSSLCAPSPSPSHPNPRRVRKSCRSAIKYILNPSTPLPLLCLHPSQSHNHPLPGLYASCLLHSFSTL